MIFSFLTFSSELKSLAVESLTVFSTIKFLDVFLAFSSESFDVSSKRYFAISPAIFFLVTSVIFCNPGDVFTSKINGP